MDLEIKNWLSYTYEKLNEISLVSKIFFDRGIYKYHGRVKVFAETLRKNGMEF